MSTATVKLTKIEAGRYEYKAWSIRQRHGTPGRHSVNDWIMTNDAGVRVICATLGRCRETLAAREARGMM